MSSPDLEEDYFVINSSQNEEDSQPDSPEPSQSKEPETAPEEGVESPASKETENKEESVKPDEDKTSKLIDRNIRQVNKLKKDKMELLEKIKQLEEQNKKINNEFSIANKAAMEHYETSVKLELEEAKRLQAIALEEGDAIKQSEAIEKIAKAATDARNIENYKKQLKKEQDAFSEVKETKPSEPTKNEVSATPEISAWINKNSWFDESSDDYDSEMAEEVKAYDAVLSRQYQRMGKQAQIGGKEYLRDIDNYVRDKFYMENPVETTQQPPDRKPFSKVSPVTSRPNARSASNIQLTDAQKEIAEGLGLTEEKFRESLMRRLNANKGAR